MAMTQTGRSERGGSLLARRAVRAERHARAGVRAWDQGACAHEGEKPLEASCQALMRRDPLMCPCQRRSWWSTKLSRHRCANGL